MDKLLRSVALLAFPALVLAGCSGASPPSATGSAAATATASDNAMCRALLTSNAPSFYWEIGNADGRIVGGTVSLTAVNGGVTRDTLMPIASASKWLYAIYVVQKRGGPDGLSASEDVPFLNFTSGYSRYGPGSGPGHCLQTDTVQQCVDRNDSTQDPNTIGHFAYNSAHMEVHAAERMNLGPDANRPLALEVLGTDLRDTSNIGVDGWAAYTQPLLAGGVAATAAAYATVLQGVLSGELKMHDALMNDAAYTVPTPTANSASGNSPLAGTLNADGVQEQWSYSLGHWVENDPTYGDGAFSSAGAFGFYPWIDHSLSTYGLIARVDTTLGEQYKGYQSAECGRLIRQAYRTGVEVTALVPDPHD